MIRIESVKHQFKNSDTVLRFYDWNINRGEQWLMLGNSGSGKTTLLHAITGLLKPTAGRVLVNEKDIYNISRHELDHLRGSNFGMVFQQAHIIKSLTVKENLLVAQHFAGAGQDMSRIDSVLRSLNIFDKIDSYPRQLSQGQLQRVAIARAVVNRPGVIVADEPTSSLDDHNTEAVIDLLISQAEQNGATLIISTHDTRVKSRFEKQYQL